MTSLTPFETLEERSPSAILANLLYLMFLVMGVILLVNMMIALLSNTYQKVQVKVSITLTAFPLVYCQSFKVRDFAEMYFMYALTLVFTFSVLFSIHFLW